VEVHGVSKDLVRISKAEWRYEIYTERGWKVQMREKELSVD